MKIVEIELFQVDLPYSGGVYVRSGGREYTNIDASIVRILTDCGFKEISNSQLLSGISVRMAPIDNWPHYYAQRECFYIFEGETLLNMDGKYTPLGAGTNIDSGPNVIHDFVAMKPGIYA